MRIVDIHYVENEDYSFYDSRTYQGLTGTKVPLDTHDMEGMRELLHETPTIAADGSTHVEVYYDRIYYMTRVYLMGGYGIYSVYARYGANLQPHLTAPVRPGYLFAGWDAYTIDTDNDDVPDSGEDGKVDAVYPTVPAKNLAYVALWEEKATAQVNVVFWGENPNDEGYSYLSTKELHVAPGITLTYSAEDDAIYVCGLDPHTHTNDCVLNCTKAEQPHLESCYKTVCGKVEHVHSTGCYTCGHTHSANCYTVSYSNGWWGTTTLELTAVNDEATLTTINQTTPWTNGIVRTGTRNNNYRYYIELDNQWYRLTSAEGTRIKTSALS